LTLVNLLQQVVHEVTEQFQQTALLPEDVHFDFDPCRECAFHETASNDWHTADSAIPKLDAANGHLTAVIGPTPENGKVLKTTRRTVVSLEYGRFQAHETVRQHTTSSGQHVMRRSEQLAELVPGGGRYGFDLIAYVGLETFLHGRSLQDVQQTLAQRCPAINIPLSSLWDQQQRFLFSLGRLHRRAAATVREFLVGQSQVTWLMDGTLEPDTPVFFGIEDATSGILLDGWKIPSENADDIAACLTDAVTRYGQPAGVLHDLSSAMSVACDAALSNVPHRVCHFHLARDVGNDLCAAAQIALTKRHRSLKILSRLREQRKGQTEWFRNQFDQPSRDLVLNRLLAGESLESVPFHETLSHEVLLAFHFWILDYRCDGRRRGFPFDPYTLYLHRRLVRASEAVNRLLSLNAVARQAPAVMHNFRKLLTEYCRDAQILATAAEYERAYAMFGRLREALHLSAEEMSNLRQPYDLPADAREPLQTALHNLREALRLQVISETDDDQALAQTVLTHLDKYWSYLVPETAVGPSWKRTTNQLESVWGARKRNRRQAHGRGKLTRDFQSLPAEYLLVPNLQNHQYVELVLGGKIESLPSKLADSCKGESFSSWRNHQRPRLLGQIRRHQLRSPSFLHNLIRLSADHCEADDAA
jgi:hypothetical protein